MRAAILLAAFLPLPSVAQTSTNCFVNGQWINCTSRPSLDWSLGQAQDASKALVESFASSQQEAIRNGRAIAEERRRRHALENISVLISAGKCKEAIELAIREGGLSAGEQAKRLCE